MKKICLTVVGLYIGLLSAFSQSADSANYKSRKLKFEEANLVSSYYRQTGNNSAVEGGVGSEKLSDIANVIDVKFTKYDKRNRKHSFTGEVGIDHYTSASSDRIDTKANSSASSADTRIYPSLSWTMENEQKGTTIGLHASSSFEFDYTSIGFGASFSKKSADKNREVSIKAQAFLDQVSLILPIELRNGSGGRDNDDYKSASRNSYSGSVSLSQVINERLQVAVIADIVKQDGFLALPFHRVYFNDNTVHSEILPSSRLKIPLGLRANYFFGDKVILRSFYRYYQDDWGLTAHTIDLETSVKINPFLSITPFYRYYNQSAIDYFAPINVHKQGDAYYTSNYDLSAFDSQFFGAGFRSAPPKGVFGMQHIGAIELRYGHYTRSTGLNSDIISLHLKFN
jgi:hypothetical protein